MNQTGWTFDISVSVESSLHFYSKTFSAKPKESIGRQMAVFDLSSSLIAKCYEKFFWAMGS